MKFTIAAVILFILSLAVFGYFSATPGAKNGLAGGPKIEISPKSYNFGDIEYGRILTYTFRLKNVGSETLEIKRVATSCACTSASADKNEISAGEETELAVTYDTGLMSGSHGKGEQERIIYVKTNDPLNPQVEVMIYANVR